MIQVIDAFIVYALLTAAIQVGTLRNTAMHAMRSHAEFVSVQTLTDVCP